MGEEEAQTLDWDQDSQPVPDPSAAFESFDFPEPSPPQESPALDGVDRDSDVELVETEEKVVANNEPASTAQSSERQQLSLLLQAVKLKAQEQEQRTGDKEPRARSLIIA